MSYTHWVKGWATKLEFLKTKQAFQSTKELKIALVSSRIAMKDQHGVANGLR